MRNLIITHCVVCIRPRSPSFIWFEGHWKTTWTRFLDDEECLRNSSSSLNPMVVFVVIVVVALFMNYQYFNSGVVLLFWSYLLPSISAAVVVQGPRNGYLLMGSEVLLNIYSFDSWTLSLKDSESSTQWVSNFPKIHLFEWTNWTNYNEGHVVANLMLIYLLVDC